MPGFRIFTDAPPELADRVVLEVGDELDFDVEDAEDGEFSFRKGSFVASIFAGAFVKYCNFRVYVTEHEQETEITIERNSPWWTGILGIDRVKKEAKKLADTIEDVLEEEGAQVLDSTTL